MRESKVSLLLFAIIFLLCFTWYSYNYIFFDMYQSRIHIMKFNKSKIGKFETKIEKSNIKEPKEGKFEFKFIGPDDSEILVPSTYDWNRNDDKTATDIINTYIKARQNYSIEDVAEKVFKVNLKYGRDPKLPHSYPFVNGDTFRAFADLLIPDNIKEYNWAELTSKDNKNGTILYVRGSEMGHFADRIFPKLKYKFVLLSHGHDISVPATESSRKMLDDPRVIAIFAQNIRINHRKLIAVPLGFRNRANKVLGADSLDESLKIQVPPVYSPSNLEESKGKRKNLVYVNYNDGTNPDQRQRFRQLFHEYSLEIPQRTKTKHFEYLNHISESKFTASPPGTGEDCYRTWEAILLRSIPIVRNSSLWPLYRFNPVYVIDPPEKKSVTKEELLNFRVNLPHKRNAVLIQYWFDIINAYKNKFS